MARKATKVQSEYRVRVVYELLLADTTYSDIVRYAAENWKIKSRATDNVIRKAYDLIKLESERLRKKALDRHLVQRANIRHNALKDGDRRLAFDILRDEGKLLNLYPDATVKVDWQEKLSEGLDPAVVKKRLAALLAASVGQGEEDDSES